MHYRFGSIFCPAYKAENIGRILFGSRATCLNAVAADVSHGGNPLEAAVPFPAFSRCLYCVLGSVGVWHRRGRGIVRGPSQTASKVGATHPEASDTNQNSNEPAVIITAAAQVTCHRCHILPLFLPLFLFLSVSTMITHILPVFRLHIGVRY